jgi:hypothetical protein|tara:strand:- start:797 stop:931 length:135 start_codon:yes stop_codon:yes gene_type:complete
MKILKETIGLVCKIIGICLIFCLLPIILIADLYFSIVEKPFEKK